MSDYRCVSQKEKCCLVAVSAHSVVCGSLWVSSTQKYIHDSPHLYS